MNPAETRFPCTAAHGNCSNWPGALRQGPPWHSRASPLILAIDAPRPFRSPRHATVHRRAATQCRGLALTQDAQTCPRAHTSPEFVHRALHAGGGLLEWRSRTSRRMRRQEGSSTWLFKGGPVVTNPRLRGPVGGPTGGEHVGDLGPRPQLRIAHIKMEQHF